MSEYRHQFTAVTPSSKIILEAEFKQVQAESIAEFVEKARFDLLCESGCINYGKKWSCPPYAPNYGELAEGFSYLLVVLMYLDLAQLFYIKNSYLKVKAANTIMKSRVDRVLRTCADKYNGILISTGSCRLCKPCKCKLGQPCAHMDKKAYSFEALGVNVSAMAKEYFNHDLLWYKKNQMQDYTSVLAGVLCNDSVDLMEMVEKELASIK